jgi:hypothetical protein
MENFRDEETKPNWMGRGDLQCEVGLWGSIEMRDGRRVGLRGMVHLGSELNGIFRSGCRGWSGRRGGRGEWENRVVGCAPFMWCTAALMQL